jgi:hypothetical protein
MNILKHDPMAFLVTNIKPVVSNLVLTLSKSDLMELLANIDTLRSTKIFNLSYRVGSRREDEINWCGWSRILI